ncbi:MAG: DUF4834 domain-containing protein [Flavobacterium sp.]|nr:DUF4834 domain-containing protein [Pedobacter sp.]
MTLLKILFIIISVLWLLKTVARLLLPVLFQKLVNKAQNHAAQQYQSQSRPDGKIKVDFIPPRSNDEKLDKVGDFVDYEEVK